MDRTHKVILDGIKTNMVRQPLTDPSDHIHECTLTMMYEVRCKCGALVPDKTDSLKFHFEHCDDAKLGTRTLLKG